MHIVLQCLMQELNFFIHGQNRSNFGVHACQTCGKNFNRADNLRVHERTHSKQKAFKCHYCTYGCLLNPYVLLKKLNIPDIEKYCGVEKTKQNLSIFESMECSNDVASKINTSKVDHIPLHSSLKLCIKCKVKGEKTLTPWKCKACDQPLCCQRSGERCFDSFHSSLNIPRKHVPSRMLKRGTCRQCKIKGKKNRTYWKCCLCDHPLCCQKNRETCFDQFHAVLSTNPENVSSERISVVRNTSGEDVLNDKNVSIDVTKKNKVESEILEESDDNTDHVPVKLISRKMCLHCKANGKSVRTSWRCRGCCKPLCNQTTGECCFQLFHSSDVEKTENLKLDSEKQQSAEQKNSMHVNSLPTIMSDDHLPLYTMVKRDCVYCKAKGSKALTNWHCNACGKPLCRQRYGNTCFYMYHSPTEVII
ncbi:hypothetical protein CEXT_401681 [Caerostris extrusa]|uniref:C2H2-type domain-containing protein n=1 Tax=Caerostris extrusa TaxID=172846 RepID=A0AAV4RAM8_CAEEX|nr:hypothetical protein CEXT_401681 [Caerostris extrusa]